MRNGIALISRKGGNGQARSRWGPISAFTSNFAPDIRSGGSIYNLHIGDCVNRAKEDRDVFFLYRL